MGWIYILGVIVVLVGASAFFGAPYVPTRRRDLRRMLDELYPLSTRDVVLDFGSGDGVVLREVSRRKAKAVGYEINPIFWAISKLASFGDARVRVVLCNSWMTAFPDDVTIVYAFSVGRDSKKLARVMQGETDRLGRALFLVSYGNPLTGIKPLRTFEAYFMYEFQPLHLKKA